MIKDEEQGVQFDGRDGTIGDLQLVKRWVLTTPDGWMWGRHYGQNTSATQEEAEEKLRKMRESNPNIKAEMDSLSVTPWWCYPVHFDPVNSAAPCRCDACRWLEPGEMVLGALHSVAGCPCGVCDALRLDEAKKQPGSTSPAPPDPPSSR